MECDPNALIELPVGVAGLLGTAQEVLLTIDTLDGRRHSQVLRPTRSFFIVPSPPSLFELVWDTGLEGVRRVAQRPEMALLVVVVVFLVFSWGTLAAAIFAFAGAQALGQWLGGQNWMAVSPFLPRALTALTALVVAMEIVRGQPVLRPGWLRPWWVVMMFLGILYGAAYPETIPGLGLSRFEQSIGFFLFSLGVFLGLAMLVLCAHELRAASEFFPDAVRDRWVFLIGYLAGVAACALFLYQASAPAFVGAVTPAVLWCRTWKGTHGIWLGVLAGIFFVVGLALNFQRVELPLDTLAVFGSLALLGAALILPRRLPLSAALGMVPVAMFYHGWYAGHLLRDNTSLPVANAAGMVVVVTFLFYACFLITERDSHGEVPLFFRGCGAAAMLMAVLWRLGEYQQWLDGPITSELAMGLLRVPLLAAVLLVAAWLAWPRKRRFQVHSADAPRALPVMHWVLLAFAFFALPLGTLSIRNPFHTARAPTVTEAKRIMSTLLSDTYSAFNLPDENEAFDRLARNISGDLMAAVYLDSRRRLTAGTRQGAEVTVKDVSVMSVDEALRNTGADNSFTYPCKWIVTARVKHWQHIHNRQNVYIGELTIRVENDRWKIAQITLKNEERVVLPWRTS
jgi:hydrogenase/urease accessory protein HupE